MPKPPTDPRKALKPIPQEIKRPGMIAEPGRLPVWVCPLCRRSHYGFSRRVCRNEGCEMFGKEASN